MDLVARADALQAEALREFRDLGGLLDEVGVPMLAGSAVSGLMVWRDLDVMVLGGPGFDVSDVHTLIGRVLRLPGVAGFEYADERGDRSPTRERRDERFHLAIRRGAWRIEHRVRTPDDFGRWWLGRVSPP